MGRVRVRDGTARSCLPVLNTSLDILILQPMIDDIFLRFILIMKAD